MVTVGMELSQRADDHPLDAAPKAAERRIIMAEYHIGCGAFGIYVGTQQID